MSATDPVILLLDKLAATSGTIAAAYHTLDEFKRLIVLEVAAKRWVYHPWQDSEKAYLDGIVEHEAATARNAFEERERRDKQERELMKLHLSELGRLYTDAVIAHGQLRSKVSDAVTEEEKVELAAAVDRILFFAEIFAKRGFPEAGDEFLYLNRGCLLDRLLSIRLDKCVGYRMNTAWQVTALNIIAYSMRSPEIGLLSFFSTSMHNVRN